MYESKTLIFSADYSLSLSFNHQSIPSDASGRVSVTDISKDVGQDHNALACLYKTATLSRYSRLVWYLNDSMILSTGHFGWISSLTLWNFIPMATLYRDSNGTAVEGLFRCCLLDRATNTISSSVSVGIYYPSECTLTLGAHAQRGLL